MASNMDVHFADLTAEYDIVLDRVREMISRFPPLLQRLAEPLLPEFAEGEFSRIVALLPYWVADLLDEPESEQVDGNRTLAMASLLGWWSYLVQDALLDRDLDRPELLPLAMAFYAAAIRLMAQLLHNDASFWEAFERLSLTSAEAHCWEQRRQLWALAGLDGHSLDPETFDLDDLERMADRSALLQLAVVAQFALRDHGQENPLCAALMETLRHYTVARQIGDDRTDWVEDLQNGRLTYVSARIVRRMMETGAVQAPSKLDADQMAGFFLYDDDLFADIQRVAMAACRRAAETIAPYNTPYLDGLIARLAKRLDRGYEAEIHSRYELRELYSARDEARLP